MRWHTVRGVSVLHFVAARRSRFEVDCLRGSTQDKRQGLASGRNRLIDVVLGMSGRDEGRFELAARKINAASQHLPEESRKGSRIAPACIGVIVDGTVVEEESQHASNPLHDVL
jgi:hypothetical protein